MINSRRFREGIIAGGLLFLSGCSVFAPVEDVQNQYIIGKTASIRQSTHSLFSKLVINRPLANAVIDTSRMGYSPRKWQIAYFAKNSWAARPPDMLKDLLIETFQKSGAFLEVTGEGNAREGDFTFNSEVIRFWEDFSGKRPRFQFVFQVKITRAGKKYCDHRFSQTRLLSENTPYAGVIAANNAVADVLSEVEHYCMKKIMKKGNKP